MTFEYCLLIKKNGSLQEYHAFKFKQIINENGTKFQLENVTLTYCMYTHILLNNIVIHLLYM
jgi:hypothetical protein